MNTIQNVKLMLISAALLASTLVKAAPNVHTFEQEAVRLSRITGNPPALERMMILESEGHPGCDNAEAHLQCIDENSGYLRAPLACEIDRSLPCK